MKHNILDGTITTMMMALDITVRLVIAKTVFPK